MTGEQTFLGLSNNALYRIDPRLQGDKLVDSELKQYATKNGFTAAATTDKGYIVVASSKGDIRMFDRLGINAKTHIPALGDPIIGLDVSANGRWVLATTRTYLLLIDALQSDGKNEGKLGFEKSLSSSMRPRLLCPSHPQDSTPDLTPTKQPSLLQPAPSSLLGVSRRFLPDARILTASSAMPKMSKQTTSASVATRTSLLLCQTKSTW